jgi:uncharacterized Zn finger protein
MGMATQESTAKAKERALALGTKVYELEPGKRYVALSASKNDLAYEIVLQSGQPGDITCTCPGATYRGICRHIGKIMLMLEADQLQVNDDKEVNDHLQVHDHLEQGIADLYYR